MDERDERLRKARALRPAEDEAEQPQPRRRIPFGQFESWIDRQIRQAQERGDFDNLAGTGRPLGPADPSEVFAGDDAMGLRLLKNNEALPAWIELNKEIAAAEVACRRILAYYTAERDRARRGRLADDYRRHAGDLNRTIEHYNYIVPATSLEKVKRQIDRDLREADERRWAERDGGRRTADGSTSS